MLILLDRDDALVDLPEGDFVSAQKACELLGVKPATLYAYVSRGILHSYKQGIKRQRLYKQSELEALLRLRPGDTPSPATTTQTAQDDKSRSNKGQDAIPLAEDWVPYT